MSTSPTPGPAPAARVIHTGQAIVDLVMRLPVYPSPGGDVFATDYSLQAGGGTNTMVAAARAGASVVYAGRHGTGPLGDTVRTALAQAGVDVLAAPTPGADTGFCVAVTTDDAERTFISTVGVEGQVEAADLEVSAPRPGDVVYVEGYSMVHEPNRRALTAWLPSLPAGVEVLVDPTPMIESLEWEAVRTLMAHATIWTTNAHEARVLADRLAREDGSPALPDDVASPPEDAALAELLARTLDTVVILRAGADGCLHARPGQEAVHTPAYPVEPVDTNGAGDAHAGVLAARLCAGEPLARALTWANTAAALAVTRLGPATCPTWTELSAAVASRA